MFSRSFERNRRLAGVIRSPHPRDALRSHGWAPMLPPPAQVRLTKLALAPGFHPFVPTGHVLAACPFWALQLSTTVV
jgi:hypothetical protein